MIDMEDSARDVEDVDFEEGKGEEERASGALIWFCQIM